MNQDRKVCQSCGREIGDDAIFCDYCRYPTAVHSAYKIGNNEIRACVSDLVFVMKRLGFEHYENKELSDIFHEIVRLYWLRPESALFRFVEAKILHKYINKYMLYPMLDMGCGEGLFTSILFGARINEAYDNYESIDMDQNDPYNRYTEVAGDFLVSRPSPIGVGIDIKENSVRKARDLAVYDSVDTGDIRNLPYDDSSFLSVFANMIDDIKDSDLEMVFNEACRVLKSDGCFVFTTPNEKFLDYMYYYNKKDKIDILKYDKGRSEWIPRAKSLWIELSDKFGFKMLDYVEYGDRNLISFWDTGFRPLFGNLLELRARLKSHGLLEVRNVWVEIMKAYLYQFAETQKNDGGFSVVVLKKA